MEQAQSEKGKLDETLNRTLVLALDSLDRTSLELVGGKAANLGELIHSGFSVPPGFCLTTSAYTMVSAELAPILEELSATMADNSARLTELAATARDALLQTPLPVQVSEAVTQAYHILSKGTSVPVAVRSSATTEDLPSASFAGQYQTFLNVIGIEAVLSAITQCWASLWDARAVIYRQSLGIDPCSVRVAVVIQQLVEAQVAGVIFTANPLTGKRRQSVIDASGGLGEAVVSGTTNPDHFVVNTPTGQILERRLGDKRVAIHSKAEGGTERIESPQSDPAEELTACLCDPQIKALARLGSEIEARFGVPQDIE